MRSVASRTKGVDRHESGDVTREYGLVVGRVTELADALECTHSELLEAAEGRVTPLVDTARPNPGTHTEYDRSDDPALRCLCLTESDFQELAAVVGAREALEDNPTDRPDGERKRDPVG